MRKINTASTNLYKDYSNETQAFMFAIHKYLKSKFGTINDEWIGSLKMLAENYELFTECSKVIREQGILVTDRFSVLVKNPALKVQTDAQIQCVKLLNEFALTPKAAAKLFKSDDNEDADEYLNGLING